LRNVAQSQHVLQPLQLRIVLLTAFLIVILSAFKLDLPPFFRPASGIEMTQPACLQYFIQEFLSSTDINSGPLSPGTFLSESFGVSDPKEKYGKIVPHLIYDLTSDFRSRYEYRTAK